ncbi:DUF6415 family natural product biosynthesis protein [Streptomyces sp. NPDC093984]
MARARAHFRVGDARLRLRAQPGHTPYAQTAHAQRLARSLKA